MVNPLSNYFLNQMVKNSSGSSLKSLVGRFLMVFFAFVLVSCGTIDDLYSDITTPSSKARKSTLKTNVDVSELRELAKPPDLETGGVSSNGLKLSSGQFLNVNTKTRLFSESMRDDDDRFDRLEEAVQSIRDDFDAMTPSINRLISIEKDIKELHGQLSVLISGGAELENKNAVHKETRHRKIKKAKTQTSPAKTPQGKVGKPNIRVGDYAQKTRIVFETQQKKTHSVSFDKELQIIIVEMPYSPDSQVMKAATRRSKNIKDISLTSQSNGKTSIAISVKNVSKISSESYIGPSAANPNHRYYIDLFL